MTVSKDKPRWTPRKTEWFNKNNSTSKYTGDELLLMSDINGVVLGTNHKLVGWGVTEDFITNWCECCGLTARLNRKYPHKGEFLSAFSRPCKEEKSSLLIYETPESIEEVENRIGKIGGDYGHVITHDGGIRNRESLLRCILCNSRTVVTFKPTGSRGYRISSDFYEHPCRGK